MENKLVIVEGLPGLGKPSTSQFICDQLQRNGRESVISLPNVSENPARFME